MALVGQGPPYKWLYCHREEPVRATWRSHAVGGSGTDPTHCPLPLSPSREGRGEENEVFKCIGYQLPVWFS